MKPVQCCPFCHSDHVSSIELDERQWAVICNHCKATGPQVESEQEANARWDAVCRTASSRILWLIAKLLG